MSEQWPVKLIADICEIFGDGDWIESKDQSLSGIRLVQTGNIGEGVFKDRKDKSRYISESTFSRLNCTEIFEGDCLISRLPRPVGRACLIPNTGERMITAVDCSILRFKQDMILPQYFVYYSQSAHYNNQIQPLCTGSTRKRISRKNLGTIEIPIPPLEEQQRIVSILDESFQNIENRALQVEQKLHNGKEIFQSILANIFSKKGEGWVEKTLGEFCEIYQPKTISRKQMIEDGEYPVFGANGVIGRYNEYNHEHSELLITCRGATCGSVNVSLPKSWINGNAMVVRPDESLILRRCLEYAFQGPINLSSVITGSAQPQITRTNLSPIRFAFPSLSEQQVIVNKLDSLSQNLTLLEENHRSEIDSIVELKKSILQEAFNGKLTGGIAA